MNPIAGIVKDRALIFTARMLLIVLMVTATLRGILWMFGATLNINVEI